MKGREGRTRLRKQHTVGTAALGRSLNRETSNWQVSEAGDEGEGGRRDRKRGRQGPLAESFGPSRGLTGLYPQINGRPLVSISWEVTLISFGFLKSGSAAPAENGLQEGWSGSGKISQDAE